MPGPSPNPDYMDELGLFTHGEFLYYDNPDPELLLFTHGEFPRPSAVVVLAKAPGPSSTRVGGTPARRKPDTDMEDWALVLLLLDE
jgi:hypothetical protein